MVNEALVQLRDTVVVVALVVTLTGGPSLAQASPAPAPSLVRSETDHGACVEQFAPAAVIRGRVLDSNGVPAADDTILTAVLPMTSYALGVDSQGNFELPWSPSWLKEGQRPWLLVRCRARPLAGLMEVRDTAQPVIIRLEPAFTIRGRLLNSDERPMARGNITVALDNSGPPAALVTSKYADDKSGTFTVDALPRHHAYRLQFWSEGHATKTLTLASSQTGQDSVDVGAIILERRGREKPTAPDGSVNANWEASFRQTYQLAEGEVVKLLKPPFIAARQDYLVHHGYELGGFGWIFAGPSLCGGLDWSDRLVQDTWYGGMNPPVLGDLPKTILHIPRHDLGIPEKLRSVCLPRGDWIVRDRSSTDEKLKALEAIIRAELRRSIRFERRTVERDTMVVTGRYVFTPLPDKDPNRLHIFVNEPVHAGIGEVDTVGSVAELLSHLADAFELPIDNRTESTQTDPIQCLWANDTAEACPGSEISDKPRRRLLDNLARQTGLKFTVEKQPAGVWFVVEDDIH